ncbi:MAG: glycosyl hydrolase family 18 [Lachnospiraceae bacterium]|nr:glycosyl hydrolase family 18 [Lachnospiraceae bacterium]
MSKKSKMTDELLELLKEEEAAEAEKSRKENTSRNEEAPGTGRRRRTSRLQRLTGKKISASSARTERREKRKRMLRIAGGFLLLLCVVLLGSFYIRFAPTRERMDAKEYFISRMSSGEESAELADDELAVVLQDHVESGKAILKDDALYIDYGIIRSRLNSRFFWDSGQRVMIYTTALETYEIPLDSDEYTIDGSTQSWERKILLGRGNTVYMDAAFLQQYTNMEYTVSPETYHAYVQNEWGTFLEAEVKRDTQVRYVGGVKGLILTDVKRGDKLRVLEQMNKWSHVITADGFIGYVQNSKLREVKETTVTREFAEPEYSSLTEDRLINLVWHTVDSQESNSYLEADTKAMTGVNVISPTWFRIKDSSGAIESLASAEYVRKAHKMGLEVWGLVDNFTYSFSTTELLNSTEARRALAGNLIGEALKVSMDGINVDLEAITEDGGYGYVQFVRELSIACRRNGLVLSVDVPVPAEFNWYYDRKELGTVADYVIIMGYDEHYVGSEAGSVASLPFEENGIRNTLDLVPAEKIISGVPFYTRLWYTQTDDSGTSVWSEAYGMGTIAKTLETYGVVTEWNEETSQKYAEWVLDDGILCQIWVEDNESLALKAGLVKNYGLGGIAAWKLGFENSSVWSTLSENIGQEISPAPEETEAETQRETGPAAQTDAEQEAEALTEH